MTQRDNGRSLFRSLYPRDSAVERSSDVEVWDGEKWTVATATATRGVVGFEDIETILASPDEERCVNCVAKVSFSRFE